MSEETRRNQIGNTNYGLTKRNGLKSCIKRVVTESRRQSANNSTIITISSSEDSQSMEELSYESDLNLSEGSTSSQYMERRSAFLEDDLHIDTEYIDEEYSTISLSSNESLTHFNTNDYDELENYSYTSEISVDSTDSYSHNAYYCEEESLDTEGYNRPLLYPSFTGFGPYPLSFNNNLRAIEEESEVNRSDDVLFPIVASDIEDDDVQVLHNEHQLNTVNQTEEPDLIVLESVNYSRLFPRISSSLILSVIRKLFFFYGSKIYKGNYIPYNLFSSFQVPLSSILRELSPAELKYLKDKAMYAFSSLIPDSSILEFLTSLISSNKIDILDTIELPTKKTFIASNFKDLINVQDKSCTICFDNFKAMHRCTTLKCCHTFHSKCIKKWVELSWCCPVCRSKEIV